MVAVLYRCGDNRRLEILSRTAGRSAAAAAPAESFRLLAEGSRDGRRGVLATITGLTGTGARAIGTHMAVLDSGQHVVEIMRDSAGKLAERLDLLHLANLGLGGGAAPRLLDQPPVRLGEHVARGERLDQPASAARQYGQAEQDDEKGAGQPRADQHAGMLVRRRRALAE